MSSGSNIPEQVPLASDDDTYRLDKSVTYEKPKAPVDLRAKLGRVIGIRNEYVRILLAEFLGTFVLLALGDGVNAQTVLGSKEAMKRGNIVTIHVGWGLAVTMGIWAAGGVSGGHINPSFSLTCAIIGKITWTKLPFYVIGQYLGAFTGAATVFLVYYDRINSYEAECNGTRFIEGDCATAHIFATYPQHYLTTTNGFFDQFFGTAMLVGLALAVIDVKGFNVPKWGHPFMVGLIVSSIVASYEYNCGAALNPARDLGPRIFTAMAGWGSGVFTFRGGNWFWVPILGPHLGAIFGAFIYLLCISIHWPEGHPQNS